MDLIFGKFVTTFDKFGSGQVNPGEFRREVNYYT
jgi:ATP-binding cassette, subfamily B (MDR/TAP), member 1